MDDLLYNHFDPPSKRSQINHRAKVGLWHGATSRGNTGIEVLDNFIEFCIYEIPSLPDFTSSLFPDLANLDLSQRIDFVGRKQAQFVSAIHSAGKHSAVNLRYYVTSNDIEEKRLRLFIIGRSLGKNIQEAKFNNKLLGDLIEKSFPKEYQLKRVHDEQECYQLLDLTMVESISEILKPENPIKAWHEKNVCGFSFFYSVNNFTPTQNSMIEFCRYLVQNNFRDQFIVDISLIPTTSLTPVERGEVKTLVKLSEKWERDQTVEKAGGLYSNPITLEIEKDPNASEAKQNYEELLDQYSATDKVFLYSIRILASRNDISDEIATILASNASEAGAGFQISTINKNHSSFPKALNAASACSISPSVCNELIWNHPEAPETIRRIHRMVTIPEISSFFRFPIPGKSGCPGIPIDTGLVQPAEISLEEFITIGNEIDSVRITQKRVTFPLFDLAKSAFIVGMPGSGKTNLCFSLLHQLWEKHAIPFLVIEPAKTEYRSLINLGSLKEDMWVFSVGNERISPFRFNPFEILDGVTVSEHISSLVTCFNGAFDLWDPLPSIIDEAIRNSYEDRGWSEYDVGGEKKDLIPPNMDDFYFAALRAAENKSYQGETAGNIKGALEARLGALRRGVKGQCFNTRRSFPAAELMRRPVVFELDSLNDDEVSLMMMFLLNFVREYRKADSKSKAKLKHVMLLEEAHNVIGRSDTISHGESNGGKSLAVKFFTRMLAEMRALGEGIVVADQLPTAVAPEVIKNTNIKVMHRMVSAEDRTELGSAMVMTEDQIDKAAMLPPGQSYVFMENYHRSIHVIEPNFKEKHGVSDALEDKAVKLRMEKDLLSEEFHTVFLPYDDCQTSCKTCNIQIKEEFERHTEKTIKKLNNYDLEGTDKSKAWDYFQENLIIPEPNEKEHISDTNKIRIACARIHFFEKYLPYIGHKY